MCSDSTTSSGVTLATRSCTTATESRTGFSLPDGGRRRLPQFVDGTHSKVRAVSFLNGELESRRPEIVVELDPMVWRFVCPGCRLSDGGRTETERLDAMVAHLDAHRAAGHRVSDDCCEELRYWDEDVRTTYATRWREEDGNYTVRRNNVRRALYCFRCVLNSGRQVACYSTAEMSQHLDEHRRWGLLVPGQVYDKLARDRSTNDGVIATYYQGRGAPLPSGPQYEDPPLLGEWPETRGHRDGLDQASSMLAMAVAHFEGPVSESDRSAGWTEATLREVARVLRSLLGEVEMAKRNQAIDFSGNDWEGLCDSWSKTLHALRNGLRDNRMTYFDASFDALDQIAACIAFDVSASGVGFKEWRRQGGRGWHAVRADQPRLRLVSQEQT
jgi:hypothetical protein